MIPNLKSSSDAIRQPLPLSRLLQDTVKIVDILRLDQLHPVVSGNKWFKLKYNIEEAAKQGFDRLLTCGGVHSNHLHALAKAGQHFGFKVRALVRGYADVSLTPTLKDCLSMGMEIEFLDKKTYAQRYDPLWCLKQAQLHQSYWIPEGGNNELGKMGCEEIAVGCEGYDQVWLSIGSGCTFTGLEQALPAAIELRGVMAIKGGEELGESLIQAAKCPARCQIDYEGHLGGFGRCPADLQGLIHHYDALGLPLDPVYTAKLVAAFEKASMAGELVGDKRYLLIHSGGLQGRRGVEGL